MADATLDALLSANLSGTAQAVLTPDMRGAMSKGLQVVGDLSPSYDLIDTIAKGGTPDPMAAVTAMAGLATVANPIAGAALMAAGALAVGISEGLHSLFLGLGLIDPEPKPVQYVGLIKAGLAKPSGPSDPTWWPWEQFAKVFFAQGGSATDYWLPRPDSRIQQGEINVTNDPASMLATRLLIAFANKDYTIFDRPGHLAVKGQGLQNALAYQPRPRNSFEQFFFEVLKRDLEYWANAMPWIPPRTLLHAAAKAWNDKHQPAPGMAFTYQATEGSGDIIPMILSSLGDETGSGKRDTLEVVYGGDVLMSPPKAGPMQQVTTIQVPASATEPAQTLHVLTPRALPPSAQNLAFSAVFQKYKKLGMSDDAAIAAAEKEMTAPTSKAISSVTVAKKLNTGSSVWKKVGLSLLALGVGGVLFLGRGKANAP